MNSGTPAHDTPIRPQATLSDVRGGCDIAERDQNGTQVRCHVRQLRQLQDTVEVNDAEEVLENVEDDEEITAPE